MLDLLTAPAREDVVDALFLDPAGRPRGDAVVDCLGGMFEISGEKNDEESLSNRDFVYR